MLKFLKDAEIQADLRIHRWEVVYTAKAAQNIRGEMLLIVFSIGAGVFLAFRLLNKLRLQI